MLTKIYKFYQVLCNSCKSETFLLEEVSFKNTVIKDGKIFFILRFVNVDHKIFIIEFDELDYSLFMPIESTLEEEQELERLAQVFLVEISETKYH